MTVAMMFEIDLTWVAAAIGGILLVVGIILWLVLRGGRS
jgi:hypothetical protein